LKNTDLADVTLVKAKCGAWGSSAACIESRGAQPFRCCLPHYVYFYQVRPQVSSRYFYCLYCFCFHTLSR